MKAEQYLKDEIEELKGYRTNVDDDISIGKKKRYISLSQKKAKVWCRMRANIIDLHQESRIAPQSGNANSARRKIRVLNTMFLDV